MKRIISLLLIIIVLTASSITAHAQTSSIYNGLSRFAVFSDTYRTAEKRSVNKELSVRIEEGQYVEISPVHWILSKYLSYKLTSVKSSDTSVVKASYFRGSDGTLTIQLHGLKKGKATVDAVFSTYLSKLGSKKYKDARDTRTFRMKINVEVTSRGTVDVIPSLLNTQNEYVSKGIILTIRNMTETLSEGELEEARSSIAGNSWEYMQSAVPVNIIQDALGDVSYSAIEVGEIGWKNMETTAAASRGIVRGAGIFGIAELCYEQAVRIRTAYLLTKKASMWVPGYIPRYPRLTIEIENNMQHAIYDVKLEVIPDDKISFVSMTSGKGISRDLAVSEYISAGRSKEFYVDVFPAFMDTVLCDNPRKPVYLYTPSVKIRCSYKIEDLDESEETILDYPIPVYTGILAEKRQLFKKSLETQYNEEINPSGVSRTLGMNFNGYKKWFGWYKYDQVFIFACPVDVIISGRSGEELAVLSADQKQYTDGVLAGYTQDEMKVVIIPNYALDDYVLTARATGDGHMDVITYCNSPDAGASINLYEQVKITEGEDFTLSVHENSAAGLNRADASGSQEAIQADMTYTREDLIADIMTEGYTEEEAKALENLYFEGVLPAAADLQDPDHIIGLDDFSALLISAAGLFIDMSSLDITDNGLFSMDKAGAAGLLLADMKEKANDSALETGEALRMADYLLAYAGLTAQGGEEELLLMNGDTPEEEQTAEDESPEQDEANSSVIMNNWGTWAGSLSMKRDDTAPLTYRNALLLADRLIRYSEGIINGNSLVKVTSEIYDGSMDWYDDLRTIGLYAMDENESDILLRNTIWWHPSWSGTKISNKVITTTVKVSAQATRNQQARKIFDGKDRSFSPEISSTVRNRFTDEEGYVYNWAAFCVRDQDGALKDDAVYLYISRISEGCDAEFCNNYSVKQLGDYQATSYVIADQDVVAAVLASMAETYPLGTAADNPPENDSDTDRIIIDWIKRHNRQDIICNGKNILLKRAEVSDSEKLASVIAGGNGRKQPKKQMPDIPDEIMDLTGGFTSQIQYLEGRYPIAKIKEVSEMIGIDWLTREIAQIRQTSQDNHPGTIHDVSYEYTTKEGNGSGTVYVRGKEYDYDDFFVLEIEDDIPTEEITSFTLYAAYTENGETYHLTGTDSYYGMTQYVREYEHPDYELIEYRIVYTYGLYFEPSYKIILTVREQGEYTQQWSVDYNKSGIAYQKVTYNETE